MRRKVGLVLFIFFSALSLLLFLSFKFVDNYYNGEGPLAVEKEIFIPNGTSLSRVIYILAQNEIIDRPDLLKIILRFKKTSFKAGEYSFLPGEKVVDIVKKIENGNVIHRQVTIPEGYMTSQIIEIIRNIDILVGEVPESVKEGSLLPETYNYIRGEKRVDVIKRMQIAMTEALNKAWKNRKEGLPIKTKEEAVILASIVEKETGLKEERRKVAGVFINRLKKRMLLQSDPTVIYAITKGEYVLDRSLRKKDLERFSEYNTYTSRGLPPTPIANPGVASIEAVMNPEETEYLYFVADGTGGHSFSKTLAEHNVKVKNWVKHRRAQIREEKKKLLEKQNAEEEITLDNENSDQVNIENVNHKQVGDIK